VAANGIHFTFRYMTAANKENMIHSAMHFYVVSASLFLKDVSPKNRNCVIIYLLSLHFRPVWKGGDRRIVAVQ